MEREKMVEQKNTKKTGNSSFYGANMHIIIFIGGRKRI
jgi:hypothetical protein